CHGRDLSEDVLYPVVEFGDQLSLMFLGLLALGNVKIAAQNSDWLSGDLVIDGASGRRYPSHLSVRANDAKFMMKSQRLLDHSIPVRFDVFDVVGMNSLTKVCVVSHTTRFH